MNRNQSIRFVGGMVLLGIVMGAQALLPSSPESNMLRGAFLDAGHVPLFALFALLVLWLSRSTIPGSGARHYLVAILLIVVAGLGTEFVQKFGTRDAGWPDFIRDLLGGGAALLVAFAFGKQRVVVRVVAILLALFLLGLGLAELVLVKIDYRGRDAAFPSLAGFDAPWEGRFVHGHDADLDLAEAPWGGGPAGRLEFTTADYPSLSIHEPFPDWTGYGALKFSVWSELEVRLTVRVHDRAHDKTYRDRFNRGITIEPGLNEIEIPLAAIEAGPAGRTLDLRSVSGVAIFAVQPAAPFAVWFDELRLVREAH